MSMSELSLKNAAIGYGACLVGLTAFVFTARTLDQELSLEMISPKEAVSRGQSTLGRRFEIAGIPQFEEKGTRQGYQNFYSGAGSSSVQVELPVFIYSIVQNFQGKEFKAYITADTELPHRASSFKVKGISPAHLKGLEVTGPVFKSEYALVGKHWIKTSSNVVE